MNEVGFYTQKGLDLIEKYGPGLLLAIVTLVVGLWIIRIVVNSVSKGMVRAKIDESLQKFLCSMFSILLKVLLLISVASTVGIEATSFIAVLGVAGLAVGLALQGSLSNFAGGVLLLLFKPFGVGDVIDTQGYAGKVESIQILHTILKTFDNKTIIIPNGVLANGSITNYSTEKTRRVDMSFGIGYGDDIKKTKEVLQKLIDGDDRILKYPDPMIVVSELGESSVNFAVRVWCEAANYWGIFFDMQEKVKLEFDKQGISIPFPRQDVHLFQTN